MHFDITCNLHTVVEMFKLTDVCVTFNPLTFIKESYATRKSMIYGNGYGFNVNSLVEFPGGNG